MIPNAPARVTTNAQALAGLILAYAAAIAADQMGDIDGAISAAQGHFGGGEEPEVVKAIGELRAQGYADYRSDMQLNEMSEEDIDEAEEDEPDQPLIYAARLAVMTRLNE